MSSFDVSLISLSYWIEIYFGTRTSLAAQLVKNPLAMQEISVQFLGQKIHWRGNRLPVLVYLRFPGGSPDNESACNAGDLGSIPGLGRSPGEGKGYPLQYSGLENSMGPIVHGVAKSQTGFCDYHFTSSSIPGWEDPLEKG